jgi:rare lipoprotein A (peptidoglycan hydrolase)
VQFPPKHSDSASKTDYNLQHRIRSVSPRAADTLDMKRAGVAAVVVEPLVNQAAPTVAAFQASGTAMAQ